MITTFVTRIGRRGGFQGHRPSRIEVRPPSVIPGDDPLWFRLTQWLSQPAPLQRAVSAPINRLHVVRSDFAGCMADIANERAEHLRQRIANAVSLRELWHLRSAMYSAIALHHNQSEAERRMARLNRHFPTRAPRSGFATFDAWSQR